MPPTTISVSKISDIFLIGLELMHDAEVSKSTILKLVDMFYEED